MRAKEIITELFKNSAPFKWEFKGSEEAFARFTIEGVPYLFHAYSSPSAPRSWEVEFSISQGRARSAGKVYDLTGTGNAAAVMSTVVNIMREFINAYKDRIDSLKFTADENSRTDLYARMVQRLLPTWDMSRVAMARSGANFVLTSPDVVSEDSYQPPTLHTGDEILKGKFKNSPAEIKGFKKDKHNQPVLKTNKGDVQLFKPRVAKLMKEGINPDILDTRFSNTQEIGEYIYTAFNYNEKYLRVQAYDGPTNDPLNRIGDVIFKVYGLNNRYLASMNTWVDREYRNKGVASTIYAYAKMLGNTIKPSEEQTDMGKDMWKAWKATGDDKHLMREAAPAVEKPMTLCTPQDLQKLLGKGKLNALIKHPWFQQYRNYEHAFKHGVDSVGFTKVEVYCFFRSQNTTAEGKIRPLIMLQFTFSYGGTKVIQVEKYHRDKEPDENEKRMGPSAGWKHASTWDTSDQNAVEKAWDRHNNQTVKEEFIDEYEQGTDNSRQIFAKLKSLGYKKLGSGQDATVWSKDESSVIKILMPSRAVPGPAQDAERGFLAFYNFCQQYPDNPNLPKFIDIGGEHHTVFELNGVPYRQIAMEKLQPIKNGSFEEAMVWMLSDLAKIRAPWPNVVDMLKKPESWEVEPSMAKMPQLVSEKLSDPVVNRQYGMLYITMGRLYNVGLKAGLGWDLHTENAMMRPDGTIVIVDPFFT